MTPAKLIVLAALVAAPAVLGAQDYQEGKPIAKRLNDSFGQNDNTPVGATASDRYFTFTRKNDADHPIGVKLDASDKLVALTDFRGFSSAIFYDGLSSIASLKAYDEYHHVVGPQRTDRRYGQENIFLSDVSVCYYSVDMSQVGMLRTVEYTKQYEDSRYLTSVFFNEHYPIESRTFSFEIPDDVDIELKEYNFAGYDITRSEEQKKHSRVITYVAKHMVALKNEENAPPNSKTYPHILVLSKSVTGKNGKTNVLATTADLYGWYHSLTQQVKENPEALRPLVTRLTKDKTDDISKIEALYYWVQENIRYIAFEDGIMGFKPESCDSVCDNRFGDCKGKANLLKNMLKLAGYDARLTWIGTTDIPYDYSVPSIAASNHMICTVMLNGKRYFLDGTEEFIAFGDYAHRIQGRQVLIENGDSYILDSIPMYGKERNLLERHYQFSIENNTLRGSGDAVFNGEEKTGVLRGYAFVESTEREKALKNAIGAEDKNEQFAQFASPDMTDRRSPLKFHYTLDVTNKVTPVGTALYVTPELENEFARYRIDKDRQHDFEFGAKVYRHTKSEIKIPAGYKVASLPEPVSIHTPDYNISLTYKEVNGVILYEKSISIDRALISHDEFTAWNEAVEQLTVFYKTPFVLEKK